MCTSLKNMSFPAAEKNLKKCVFEKLKKIYAAAKKKQRLRSIKKQTKIKLRLIETMHNGHNLYDFLVLKHIYSSNMI